METITFTKTDKGIVVGGKTFVVKDILRAAGARWDPSRTAWVFYGTEIIAITDMIRDSIEDCVADVRRRAAEAAALAKRQKAWLKTAEGQAATAAAERARVASAFGTVGGYWLCCASCNVVDWARKHVSCKEHGFQVRGGIYTGD